MDIDRTASKNALVIGSGVAGLSTAIILAELGFKTTVIEKNPLPGGLMRGYTRKGFDCAVGVHYLGSLDDGQVLRRLFDFLGVSRGIPVERMGADGIIDRYIFEDFAFNLPDGCNAYVGAADVPRSFSSSRAGLHQRLTLHAATACRRAASHTPTRLASATTRCFSAGLY